MQESTLPLFAPTSIMPEPTKVNFVCASLTIGMQQMVGLQVATPNGVQFYFMDHEAASELARTLARVAGGIVPAGELIKGV